MNDAALKQQDKRVRRALLEAARIWGENSVTGGWSKGWILRDNAIDSDTGESPIRTDNDRAFRLLRDLTRKALLEERPNPDRPLRQGEKFTLDHCEFRISEKGARLLDEREPIDGDIQDMRIEIHP